VIDSGKLRQKTIIRLFLIYMLARDMKRRPNVYEVRQKLQCSRSSAYNYLTALDVLLSSVLA
jgi:hypothetical protein